LPVFGTAFIPDPRIINLRCAAVSLVQQVSAPDKGRYMHRTIIAITSASALAVSAIAFTALAGGKKPLDTQAKEAPGTHPAVLWRDPGDIASRNLFYGPGGQSHVPQGTFTFKEEDNAGSSPKFDVTDQDGIVWRVKMGPEARPETVASRFVWAVGYFANEDYFMPMLHVEAMQHLSRGESLVLANNNVANVRLKRHLKDEKKIGSWAWAKNPFSGSREWYGLRVLMAVLNNWDLKDVNNSVYLTRDEPIEERYAVSDLGDSFGPTGLNLALKGKPSAYCSSKLINKTATEYVDFNIPSGPPVFYIFNVPEMARRLSLTWLGKHIPRKDARWMGDLLARLSHDQIQDAFRAAGYSPQEVEELSKTLERRIGELETL
jgi:hypothetical protein